MKNIAGFVFVAFALGGCSQDDMNAHEEAASRSNEHAPHWGYAGDEGPENWGNLDADFRACSSGTQQSPIDISGAQPLNDKGLRREFGDTVLSSGERASVLDIIDNGHTIQVMNDQLITMWVDDAQYELVQYHFHAPSEHTIDGRHAALEAHFVHKSANDRLAVLGVLFEEGQYDARWEPILSRLPNGPDDDRHIEGVELDLEKIRDLPSRYYRYSGSLTTPPCSEGVSWIVRADALEMSTEQLDEITTRMRRNNRPVQSLGDRTVGLVSRDD